MDVQNHKNLRTSDPELAEGGQLLALYIDPAIARDDSDEDEHEHEHERGHRAHHRN